jgi:hypothetical protein
MLASLLLQVHAPNHSSARNALICNHAAAIAPAQKSWRSMLGLEVDGAYILLIKAYNRI